METKKLSLCEGCWFEYNIYNNTSKTMSLNYIERSPAHGFPDTETGIELQEKECAEIINICLDFLNINPSHLREISNICRTENRNPKLSSMLSEINSTLEEINPENYE